MPKSSSFGEPSVAQNIRRLKIPVDDKALMRVLDCLADFEKEPELLAGG